MSRLVLGLERVVDGRQAPCVVLEEELATADAGGASSAPLQAMTNVLAGIGRASTIAG